MADVKKLVLAGVAAMGLGMSSAQAALSIVSSVGGAPTGAIRFNFDGLTLGSLSPQNATSVDGSSVMQVAVEPNAAVVLGSASGVYAAPFLSGGNGAGFGAGGTDQADGQDTTQYLTSGSTGAPGYANAAVTLVLPFDAKYFGILWGSVDTYNTLSFYDGATLVGSITGSDVTPAATGNQGASGTFYVNINSTVAFDRVVATSTQFAFEFDNVALSAAPIPAPAALAIFGLGLLGLGLARRKQPTDA